MTRMRHRAAAQTILGAIGIAMALAGPARAEDPPFEVACNPQFESVNCAAATSAPAHNAIATVPGASPLRPVQPRDVARAPWLGHPTNPPRGGAAG